MDGSTDAHVGSTATDVPGHCFVDVRITGLRGGREQGRRLHDLAGLAVAALGYVVGLPGTLHRVRAVVAQALDGDDLAPLGGGHRSDAGANRLAVQMDGACATRRDAAGELGAGQSQLVSQVPQQRHGTVSAEFLRPAVNRYADHERTPELTVRTTLQSGTWSPQRKQRSGRNSGQVWR